MQEEEKKPCLPRPWIGHDGKAYKTIYMGGDPNKHSNYKNIQIKEGATLRRDEWQELDRALLNSFMGGADEKKNI